MSKREKQEIQRLADELHRAVNAGLDTAGHKAPLGAYKRLMRDVRDEMLALGAGRVESKDAAAMLEP